MIVELGHFTLILAFAVALLQATLPLYGAARRDARLMALADPAAMMQLVLIAAAFLTAPHTEHTEQFIVAALRAAQAI